MPNQFQKNKVPYTDGAKQQERDGIHIWLRSEWLAKVRFIADEMNITITDLIRITLKGMIDNFEQKHGEISADKFTRFMK